MDIGALGGGGANAGLPPERSQSQRSDQEMDIASLGCAGANAGLPPERSQSQKKRNKSLHDCLVEESDAAEIRRIVDDLVEHYGVAAAFLALESPGDLKLKARHGISLQSVGRRSIAKHGIARDLPIIVEDIQAHSRFAQDALVTGPPALSFFAGSPLMIAPGKCVGSLCIMDITSRTFRLRDAAFLDQCAKAICDIYKLVVETKGFSKLTVSPWASDASTGASEASAASYEEDEDKGNRLVETLGSLLEQTAPGDQAEAAVLERGVGGVKR